MGSSISVKLLMKFLALPSEFAFVPASRSCSKVKLSDGFKIRVRKNDSFFCPSHLRSSRKHDTISLSQWITDGSERSLNHEQEEYYFSIVFRHETSCMVADAHTELNGTSLWAWWQTRSTQRCRWAIYFRFLAERSLEIRKAHLWLNDPDSASPWAN